MTYIQTNNPIQRKTSPLRVDPFAKKKDKAPKLSKAKNVSKELLEEQEDEELESKNVKIINIDSDSESENDSEDESSEEESESSEDESSEESSEDDSESDSDSDC